MAIVKNGAVDLFRIFKWVFHEIKDIDLKNKVVARKLDDLIEKGQPQKGEEVAWTEEEKLSMVECLQRIVELMEKMKK